MNLFEAKEILKKNGFICEEMNIDTVPEQYLDSVYEILEDMGFDDWVFRNLKDEIEEIALDYYNQGKSPKECADDYYDVAASEEMKKTKLEQFEEKTSFKKNDYKLIKESEISLDDYYDYIHDVIDELPPLTVQELIVKLSDAGFDINDKSFLKKSKTEVVINTWLELSDDADDSHEISIFGDIDNGKITIKTFYID